jgi:hypothetical protein
VSVELRPYQIEIAAEFERHAERARQFGENASA